jgi:hypothetical protein
MSNRYTGLVAKLIVLLCMPIGGVAQTAAPANSKTLVVAGHSGQAAVVQINGKTYVDVESVARLTGGSLSFQANQTTLTLPAPPASVQPVPAPVVAKPPAFSVEFLKAGIEEMSVIREWRSALVNAVQTNSPVNDDWVSGYRRAADSKLSLAEAAASTVPDQQASVMLRNEFNNMQQMSDQFLTMRKNMNYISPDSFDNNPLDQKILSCSRALGAMAASGQVQDDISCH